MQVDDPRRGISYKEDGLLDMRMDNRLPHTGAELLATLDRAELSRALWELADERDHEKIAQWIVAQREAAPITRVQQLVRLVFDAKGLSRKKWREDPSTRYGELHPAARTFQALRILVNDELNNLRKLLRVAPLCLRPGGRIGIISFHSGEDRLVKEALRYGWNAHVYAVFSHGPIRPGASEVRANPRSASAKFRWAIKRSQLAGR
jgi:16S rRNA (cytosine1402-N4)-methyltransferase